MNRVQRRWISIEPTQLAGKYLFGRVTNAAIEVTQPWVICELRELPQSPGKLDSLPDKMVCLYVESKSTPRENAGRPTLYVS